MTDTYKVHIEGAFIGASFTLYLNDYPMSIVGGKAPSEEFDIEISNEYTGKGKVKIYGKSHNRAMQTIAYSIPVNLTGGKGQVVSFKRGGAPSPPKPSEPVATSNKLRDKVLGTVKSTTDNKLRSKVQKNKDRNSFWDKLK